MVLGYRAKRPADNLKVTAHRARQPPLDRGRVRIEVNGLDVVLVVVGIGTPETNRSVCSKDEVAALLTQVAADALSRTIGAETAPLRLNSSASQPRTCEHRGSDGRPSSEASCRHLSVLPARFGGSRDPTLLTLVTPPRFQPCCWPRRLRGGAPIGHGAHPGAQPSMGPRVPTDDHLGHPVTKRSRSPATAFVGNHN